MIVRRRRRARSGRSSASATPTSTGTTVTFWPDPTIMEELEFRAQTLRRAAARDGVPQQGPRDRLPRRARRPQPIEQIFKYDGGIVDFVTHLNASKEPLFATVIDINDTYDSGEVEIALQWNTGFYEGLHSFANNIATTEGGMHEEGFKKSLTNVVNRYARAKGHLKEKDENLLGEDIREGLTAIVSVKLRNPQFEGQTKTKLGNTEIRSFVERATNEKLAEWLEEHPNEAQGDRHEVDAGRTRAHGGAPGARPHPAQVAARVGVDAGQARRLLDRATPKRPSSSSSRATAPAAAPRRRATRGSRRSCRSAARS